MTEKAIKNISLLTDWYQYMLLKKTSLEIKTITGTLPLTVTSKGGNAVDWTIYGNNNIGKNLFGITAASTTISGVTFTVNKTAGTITVNGTADSSVYLNLPINVPSDDYYYSGCALGGSPSTYDLYAWDNTISGRPKKWDGETNVDSDYGGTSQEIKVDSEHSMQLTIRIRSGYTCNNLIFKPMLRLADTSPEFEPYQIGVGEQTKNLLEITATSDKAELNGIKFTVDKENGIVIANGQATAPRTFNVGTITNSTSETIDYYLSGGADGGSEASYFLIGMGSNGRLKKWDGTRDMSGSTSLENAQQMQIPAGATGTMRIYIRNGTVCENLVFKPMVRLSNTTPEFIPYGYEIPLAISQTGQTDKSYDIFVGSAPLVEGETVSKTSTGTNIELFEGSNTVDTTLTNKPEMTIKYK